MALSIEISSALTAIQSPEQLTEEMAFLYAQNLHFITEERIKEELSQTYKGLSVDEATRKEFSYVLDNVEIEKNGIRVEGVLCETPERGHFPLLTKELKRIILTLADMAKDDEKSETNSEKYLIAKEQLKHIFKNPDEVGKFLKSILPHKGKNKVIHGIIIENEGLFRNSRQKKEVHSILWDAGYITPKKKTNKTGEAQTKEQNFNCFKRGYR